MYGEPWLCGARNSDRLQSGGCDFVLFSAFSPKRWPQTDQPHSNRQNRTQRAPSFQAITWDNPIVPTSTQPTRGPGAEQSIFPFRRSAGRERRPDGVFRAPRAQRMVVMGRLERPVAGIAELGRLAAPAGAAASTPTTCRNRRTQTRRRGPQLQPIPAATSIRPHAHRLHYLEPRP